MSEPQITSLLDVVTFVESKDYDPDDTRHRTITVTTGLARVSGGYLTDAHADALWGDRDNADAEHEYLAGVLARIAMRARDPMTAQRISHGCGEPPDVWIMGRGSRLVTKGSDGPGDGEYVHVSRDGCHLDMWLVAENELRLVVPNNRVITWLANIDRWIGEVQPS